MFDKGRIDKLADDFSSVSKILVAIGDETRQHLIIEMMKMKECRGARVNDIASKTTLSRPAVSHHLAILKEAGLLKMRKEGTKNYYYFDPEMTSFQKLIDTLIEAKDIAIELPDRSK